MLAAAPVAKKPYTVQDQVTLKRLSGLKVSPDGLKVVFSVRVTDLEANKGKSDLWVINVDGTGLRQLTSADGNESDPTWSPDSRSIYFLATRSGSNQLWKLALDGGEATQVTNFPLDVEAYALSRDGQNLVFAAEVFVDCDTLECTAKRAAEKPKSSAQIYDSLFFRHWDTWKHGRRSHLFATKLSGGPIVNLQKKQNADAPTRPFGGSNDFTFSADGKSVVYVARDAGREEAWSTDLDLWTVPFDGSKAPVKLTTSNRATDTSPVFSPDGKTLAYLAMSRPKFEADKLRVIVRDSVSGKERSLTDSWDRSAGALAWSGDGKSLFVTADDVGQVGVFRIDVASGEVKKLLSDGNVSELGVAGNSLVVAHDSLKAASDLFTLGFDGGALKRLTDVNADVWARVQLGEPEQFSFKGWNNETVYGYVVKPVGFAAGKKYPLAFLIHGGPQGSFGNHWHYRWNPQAYAAKGYVAVMIDFHGSTGYGQSFTDSISGDWGGKPLEDLQKGLAAAQEKYPFIDKNRQCALGASYGGFMINWIAGNWNEPWKCLVNHDGNLDERMAYFDTEELWFPEWEHGGTPWENPASYAKHNPIDHVAKWKTPMLVVHGGKDYRVVDTQGMSTFTALQRKGIPSKFVYFPDENHWVLKPQNSIVWHEQVLGWLDQWTK
ncbi:MAG: peptidase S9 [Archangium gephyra]|uniref:Peptidase S9 n=1 Tax=Archangium gephyra TaxID=48 RepID=A0A2W5SWZ6_9BACT|nr:MAG: peptidase S9 [Archangium gephyra]